MPRDSSGVYRLPSGNPVVPDTLIEADWANTTLDDVANALTGSLPRSGVAPMLAPLTLSADPITQARQAVTKEYADLSLPRSGALPMLGPLILSADPITQALQAATKAYADSLVGTTQSLAANGYVKFANGFIIQWGTVTVTPQTATGSAEVVYSIPFPTAVVYRNVGRAGMIGSSNSPSVDQIHGPGNPTPLTKGAIAYVASAFTAAVQMQWIAIGY